MGEPTVSRCSDISVQYMDHMGNDNSVVNAARVSFARDASTFTDDANHRLIKYLATHKHEIPFAHTAITLRVKAPISVRTQCYKHKIGLVENEVSRRYVTETPEFYLPTFRQAPSGSVKQGSGEVITSLPAKDTSWATTYPPSETVSQENLQAQYTHYIQEAIHYYEELIELGVAPEQARFVLPQGVMTEWVWTGSLLAFARFFNLRTDSHAQREIQELAHMVGDIIKPLFPISWGALTNDQ